MLIRELRLDGFLSFAPGSEPLEMRPLNVLIGPNGAGKSNVIEALSVLSATPYDLADVVRMGGGTKEWLWKGVPEAKWAEIEVVLDRSATPTKRDIRYRLRFGVEAWRLKLVDECIEAVTPGADEEDAGFYYRFQRGRPVMNGRTATGEIAQRRLDPEDMRPDQSVLAQRKNPEQYPEVTWLGRTFGEIRTPMDWTFGRRTPARKSQPGDLPEHELLPDGANLALVLNDMLHVGDNGINRLLRRFFPRFRRLSTRLMGGSIQFYMHEDGFKSSIPAIRLSDGTVRFIALLAALTASSPPPLLCIEGPELGLHPDAVALLAEVLVEASSRMQIVVATHSDVLVSQLSDQPDAVVACERLGGRTTLQRLEPGEVASVPGDYLLGDLWRMGHLGANP